MSTIIYVILQIYLCYNSVREEDFQKKLSDSLKEELLLVFFFIQTSTLIKQTGASLMAQWLRICLPVQGTGFEPWSGRVPHAAEQLGP